MDFKILLIATIMITVSTGTVFAQESLISIKTDKSNYDEGETIVISGHVKTIISETPITLQVFTEGNLVEIAQITVAEDGSFSHMMIAEGQYWNKQGEYLVKASYGIADTAESYFNYIPKSEIIQIENSFEVNARDKGTFDIEYTIKGGTVENIEINPEMLGLKIEINSINEEGTITLNLPREYIGAEKQNGKDEKFIILIDGVGVPYEETAIFSDFRGITINFIKGDSTIDIIGTYVVPEFGAIVMMILVIGIISTIVITRNRIQMKI